MNEQQRDVCFGPRPVVTVFDRAVLDDVSFTCARLEGSKKAKDSLVSVRIGGAGGDRIRAALVQAFISHPAPGAERASLDDKANIAYVHWYKDVPADQPAVDLELGCPVFSRVLASNEASGNMCPVEWILPCKVACFAHKYRTCQQIVVVSRFRTFMNDHAGR